VTARLKHCLRDRPLPIKRKLEPTDISRQAADPRRQNDLALAAKCWALETFAGFQAARW